MTLYKVTYRQGHRMYEELFLERDFACEFFASLKLRKDIVSMARLTSVTISPSVLTEENIIEFGVLK